MMISYAQNFEDVILWRALKNIKEGCYIDVGAWDPVVDSVSMFFYSQGWRGIHVEPNPFYAKKLREARPNETIIEAAIGDGIDPTTLFVIGDTGLTTSSKTFRDQHKSKGFTSETIKVPTRTLASIFDEAGNGDIHWLKIDAEGMEEDVIKSWGNNPARPWIVVVESTLPSTDIEVSYGLSELAERGYTHVYFDALNKFYVHEHHSELLSSFKSGPNLFDDFISADHKKIRDQGEALAKDIIERTEDLVATRRLLEERTELLENANKDLVQFEKDLSEQAKIAKQAVDQVNKLTNEFTEEKNAHKTLRSTLEKTIWQMKAAEKSVNVVVFASNPFLYFIFRKRIKQIFQKFSLLSQKL